VIVAAEHGNDAGVIGTAALALDMFAPTAKE
jgi:glucokinase